MKSERWVFGAWERSGAGQPPRTSPDGTYATYGTYGMLCARTRPTLSPFTFHGSFSPPVLNRFRNRLAYLGGFRLAADVSRARAIDQDTFDCLHN